MSTPFEEMTNAELKEACEDFGLEVQAKTPGKPNKTEYLEAIGAFKLKQDSIHSDKNAVKELANVAAPVVDGSNRKPQTPSQLMKLDLFKKDRVIVRDMQEAQTKDELVSISWGNRLIGRQTDWIDLSGEPQYVRRGALGNLKDATTTAHVPKAGGGVSMVRKKRFVVVPVEPLSELELAELASQQKMRNSKLA